MATISIAGNTLIGCLGVGSFTGIGTAMSLAQRTANSLTQTLSQLRGKVNVAAQAADVSAASAGSSRALAREERKEGAISLAYKKLDWLLSDAAHVDNQAAGAVEQLKKDFYKQYGYLKPECEKSRREKIKDVIKGAWDGLCEFGSAVANFVCDAYEWCKEHLDVILKAIAVVVLLVVSVVLLATGVGGILAAACWGCIFGIVFGFVSGGVESVRNGGSFWEGAIDGALKGGIQGAITGAIFGGIGALGQFFGSSMQFSANALQFLHHASQISGGISVVMSGFDVLAMMDQIIDPSHNPIAELNNALHENNLYNVFQTGVAVIATFTGGAYQSMNNKEFAAQQHAIEEGKKDYRNLYEEHSGVKSQEGKPFTKTVKDTAVEENMRRNNGVLRDDTTGERIYRSSKGNQKGVTPPSNEAQFDHRYPRAKGGKSGYENLQIISRDNNCRKSDSLGFSDYHKSYNDHVVPKTNNFGYHSGVFGGIESLIRSTAH